MAEEKIDKETYVGIVKFTLQSVNYPPPKGNRLVKASFG